MFKRVYRNWMDSLNFFVGLHSGGDTYGDLSLLRKHYQFHNHTIWLIRYVVAAPLQFASLFFFISVWPTSGWFVLPFMTFNLLLLPPSLLWLFLKLDIIKR